MACFEPQDGNKAAAAYASSQAYQARLTDRPLPQASAAVHCYSHVMCLQVFQAEMTAAYGDTNHALRRTFDLLDEGFRRDTNVAGQVCRHSCTCCMMTA